MIAPGHEAVTVIGGVNMDIWGRPYGAPLPGDSNPGKVELRPGGVGRNIAHDLRLLGLKVSLIAPLGGDVYASAIAHSCTELGIDLSLSPVLPDQRSSTYLYITDQLGDMLLAVNDMGICQRLTPELLSGILPQVEASALVLDANLPAESILYICEHSDLPIYADPVSAAKAEKLLPVLHRLEALKPNLLEAQALTGETDPEKAARALLKAGVKRLFLSLGADGMLAAQGDELLQLPPLQLPVVNTTGAGDAAAAAMVLSGIRGLPLRQAAELCQRAGAITCGSESANAPELSQLAGAGII